jgi:hypothetical protein
MDPVLAYLVIGFPIVGCLLFLAMCWFDRGGPPEDPHGWEDKP